MFVEEQDQQEKRTKERSVEDREDLEAQQEQPPMGAQQERLTRFLAHAGVASRRHAESLIAAGRVQVNGLTVTSPSTHIHPLQDLITVDGAIVQASGERVYLMLHKPIGYVSTAYDPQGRPTVLDLLPPRMRKLRVYPVGRLDIDTSGLLLLTNDGDFALRLTHPRYSLPKRYKVLVQGQPSEATLQLLRRGVQFTEDDGHRHRSAPAQVRMRQRTGSNALIELTIHEGRKRQVRRMLAAVGHPVIKLERVALGSLQLGSLAAGKWRPLTAEEIAELRNASSSSH